MSEESRKEVKWNDKPLLLRTALVGLVFLSLFLTLGERARPPEGYVFKRLPIVQGVYQCCGAGGRYSQSWVGGVNAACNHMAYFPFFGMRWSDCGHKDQLNGKVVEIQRVITPTLIAKNASPVVIKLSSGGNTYLEYSDQKIRELWTVQMRDGAFGLAFVIALIFQFIQLVYLDRKSRNISRAQA